MADLITPAAISINIVDYMKFKPGFKIVVGPEIAVVVANQIIDIRGQNVKRI